MIKYSFIIPLRTEIESAVKLAAAASEFEEPHEIIISSCTRFNQKLFDGLNVKFMVSDFCSRGRQLNSGAEVAKGEILVFVHADTMLNTKALNKLSKVFEDKTIDISTFCLGFDSDNWILKIYSFFSRFDSIFTTFGDQIISVRKAAFESLGKFPDYRIMEDVAFLRKARKRFKIKKINCKVITSPIRFKQKGIIKTQLLNLYFIIWYINGGDTEKIYEKYYA